MSQRQSSRQRNNNSNNDRAGNKRTNFQMIVDEQSSSSTTPEIIDITESQAAPPTVIHIDSEPDNGTQQVAEVDINEDERLARMLQEQEYYMNLIPNIPYLPVRFEAPREPLQSGMDSAEASDYSTNHEISDDEDGRESSEIVTETEEDRYSPEEYDEFNFSEGSYYDDDDEDDEESFERYRQAVSRVLGINAGDHYMDTFARIFELVEQVRRGRRYNNFGPFIADEDFDSSYEALLNLSERIGEVKKRGMTSEALAKLKTVKYKQTSDSQSTNSCPICLESYKTDDKLVLLDCNHQFHVDCGRRWLQDRASCPVCRVEFPQ